MSIAFRSAPFKTSGGTTARSLDAWFSDVVNVAEFASLHTGTGNMGEGTGDDTPCIQAAFDLAFGSPPNGWDNRHLNRPVYIPPGIYRIFDSTLSLTKVVGGHIYGAGKHSTRITWEGFPDGVAFNPTLDMNGCSDLCIEKMSIGNTGAGGAVVDTNTCVINIGWDKDDSGNGCDGNHSNHFQELQLGGGEFTVIIGTAGDADTEGYGNIFLNCNIGNGTIGVDARGPAALDNSLLGCAVTAQSIAGVHCPSGGGSVHLDAWNSTGNGIDFLMESGRVMYIGAGRSESAAILRVENGVVTMQSVVCGTGTIDFVELNGGICIVEGSDCHDAGQITGTGGTLYLAGNYFGGSTTPLSGYSGTVAWNPGGVT